jgi:hypothetical protein
MTDLTSIYISIVAVAISIVSVYYYKRQADVMKTQADVMNKQADTAEKTLKLYREELNSTNERFLMEEKSKHYEKLIGSMQNWGYNPSPKGEMINLKTAYIVTTPTNIFADTSYIPYLEQAKSHLQAYKEIWKLYEGAPSICQTQKQQEQDFKEYLESKFRDDINSKQISVIESDMQALLDLAYRWILDDFNKKPEEKRQVTPIITENSIAIGNHVMYIRAPAGVLIANDLTNILNQLLKDTAAVEKATAIQKTIKSIQQNKEQFEALLREIVASVRLSNYRNMKGQCDACSIFTQK